MTAAVGDDAEVPFGLRLTQLAQGRPDDCALVVVARDGSERRLTWTEVDRGANRWGRALAAAGAGLGERVALALPNSVEGILATLGSWKIGAVPVPVRWDLPDWERERVLDVVGAAVVLDEAHRAELAALADRSSDDPLPIVVSPQLNGICSSGSTGAPKVIMNLRPATWIASLSDPIMTNWRPVARPQRILVAGPMYHTNGFATLNFLLGGDSLVVLEKFDAALVVQLIERHRITTFTATPTMLQRIAAVDGIGQADLSSVDWILQGAAIMPPALLRRWFELLGPEQVVMAYGMTEQLGLTSLRGDEWLAHQGSVGRGFRGTEFRILAEDGTPAAVGELGDIYLRWPASGLYDYRGGAPLLPTTSDGFGTAGDMGYVDEDGYLYLVDRRVDMIVTGGANVFPAEVELALLDHPGIDDVVVIGLSDPDWGRRVHAVVQLADPGQPLTADAVIAWAKGRLASYKAPKTVEFVEEIPRSAATKVSRAAILAAREAEPSSPRR
jgi:bile acid-coenzyme A ligase